MSRQSTLPEDLKAKWVAALRSGEYAQGLYNLRRPGTDGTADTYCCLGVLCELTPQLVARGELDAGRYIYAPTDEPSETVTAGLPVNLARYFNGYDLPHVTLTPTLARATAPYARLWDDGQISLSSLNDNGTPFTVIADIIEELL